MAVTLISYMPAMDILNKIPNQSRNIDPEEKKSLFEQTIEWDHQVMQEFAVFLFRMTDFSRVLLAQITRHRIATFLIQSGRHLFPEKVIIPDGFEKFETRVTMTNGTEIIIKGNKEKMDVQIPRGVEFTSDESKEYNIGSLRYFFPEGVAINGYMLINGRSLRNLLRLRMDKHAQWEIRQMAHEIYDIVLKEMPELLLDIVPHQDFAWQKLVRGLTQHTDRAKDMCKLCKKYRTPACEICWSKQRIFLFGTPSEFEANDTFAQTKC